MNDSFMTRLRRDPPEELESGLRERLHAEHGPAADDVRREHRIPGLKPALGFVAAAAVVIAFIASPALRASAQAFLDIFRVRNFVAVKVDAARMQQFQDKKVDLKGLFGDPAEQSREPEKPQVFLNAASAGQAAGFAVRVPANVPAMMTSDTVLVQSGAQEHLTVNGKKLREVLDAIGLADVQIPPGLDGARVSVKLNPSVVIQYKRDARRIVLIQAPGPEVSLPTGLDPRDLAQIGLRVAGLSDAEARRFASTVDWRSTMLVPVPANARTFREVQVHGAKGLLITTDGAPAGSEMHGRRGSVLLWSEGDMMYALISNTLDDDLLLMANTL